MIDWEYWFLFQKKDEEGNQSKEKSATKYEQETVEKTVKSFSH
jgi:hypothetical protein